MRSLRVVARGVLVMSTLLLLGCASSEERRERTLKFYRETLSGAQERYEQLRTKAASAVGGIEGMSKTVQEEILELEKRIKEAQDAILKIQEGAGELSEGVKELGEAAAPRTGAKAPSAGVGGTAVEVEEAVEEAVEEGITP